MTDRTPYGPTENAMGDITSPRLLYVKGGLFVACGLLASGLILIECPNWRVAVLLAVAVWCFARAYYFAFYVIEHYIDPGFRFAGLWSFVRYTLARRKTGKSAMKTDPPK